MTSENTAPVSERGEWTAWLIERDGQWYAAAPHSRWTTQQAIDANTWRENWTTDANEALRFARKCDAETLIRYEGFQNAVATEHVWLEREEWPDLRDPRNIRRALRQAQDNLERAAASPAPPPPSDVVEKIARAYEIGFRKGMAFGPPWPDMDDWLALTARDEAHQIAALQGSEGGHAGKLESAPTGGASDLLDGERASIEADARRFEYLLDHHSYHYGMSIAEPSPAEWGIQWQFQQTKPGEQYLSIRDLIDRDIELRAAQDREDDEPTEAMQAAIKMHGELTASGDGASPYASTTASADTPHEQNTPSTPPDTPEGVSEAEAAMKEIFAKHGPALREALRPFQTLPAIGDEVVEAIRQMILVEEAEQTRLRSMPSAYSWNKVAVVDGKLDVLRKLSALHQAGKLPAETDMALLRRLVDLTYGFAMEDQSVPSTKVALALIEQAQDDVRDGPKDGLTMKDRLHMRGVNYTPPNSNGERG